MTPDGAGRATWDVSVSMKVEIMEISSYVECLIKSVGFLQKFQACVKAVYFLLTSNPARLLKLHLIFF